MGLPKTKEDRWFPRYHTVNADCLIQLKSADEALNARVLDVSRDGLGVLVSREIKSGAAFEFELDGKRIKMQVVFCQRDLIHAGMWRSGLRRVGSAENLVNVFASQKCIEL